ncbi:uncharacterized protein LOC128961532 [Oppia nitens]|uniref:uncharacterized protein LOC128961532 n=1 Tax=Oppia nitens TaxID=1686743 RepID=UPI0023DACE86|nr:uncharacterized protein LOC128961532 [Oppia nitens]
MVLMFITQTVCKLPHKAWIGFEDNSEFSRQRQRQRRPLNRLPHEVASDIYKQYKDSIYVSRYYNASFVCQIPFFSLTLPQREWDGSVRPSNMGYSIGYPIIQALFILAGIALVSPIIFPEERRRSLESPMNVDFINNFLENQLNLMSESAIGRYMSSDERHSMFYFFETNLKAVFETVLNSYDKSLQYFPHFAKTKVQNCFQWSVCELFNKPKKYGVIGLLFRSVFPYDNVFKNKSSNVLSKYQLAAIYGRKTSNNCKQKYNGCSSIK